MVNTVNITPGTIVMLEIGDTFIKVRDLKNNTIKQINADDLIKLISLCEVRPPKEYIALGKVSEGSNILDIGYEQTEKATYVSIFQPSIDFDYVTEKHTYKIISPDLLFFFKVMDKKIVDTRIAALKEVHKKSKIFSKTELYAYPFSHVYTDGHVCWGNTILPSIEELEVLEIVPKAFWLNGMHSVAHVMNLAQRKEKDTGHNFYMKLESGELNVNDVLQPLNVTYEKAWQKFINN